MKTPMHSSPDREAVLFAEGRHLSAEQRAAFLDKECGGETDLRQRMEDLLQADDKAGAFLKELAPESRETMWIQLVPTEKPGDHIGRYKLLQKIGEGGCGVVYMAGQEEPVRRQVALKVIKLGMDTKNVIARFEAERQALALMDHPNIAKVLDAGATENGRPYFVMELVRGVKITEYCDKNNLPTRERLNLFVQVCQAIQHAHQKGIIHRDIKPSNILVTLRDGVPVPKVIDFGIAKATTDQRLTDKTLFTAFEQFIGTPAYMSPEQAEMSELGIDTRSDIYSLGVLLYELLTGQTPFDSKQLLRSGLDEIRRIIREQEPARPSTRLSTMTATDLTTVAKHRQMEPGKLSVLVRGELDWIVMKALEKDRVRRYDTANGLARDVERYLADEPVTARPASNLYRLQKSIRRNKGFFAAATVIAVVLLVGVVASTLEAIRAKRAELDQGRLRMIAESKEKKSEQVAQFLEDMLKSVGPSVALGRDTSLLRDILDNTAKQVSTELKEQPGVEAELSYTLGEVYFDLNEFAKAETMHRRALELRQRLLGKDDPVLALSTSHLGRVCLARRKMIEAEELLRQALAVQLKTPGPEAADTLFTLEELSVALNAQGGKDKKTEAETLLRQSLAAKRKLFGVDSVEVAAALEHLTEVFRLEGKLDEAERDYREAVASGRKVLETHLSLYPKGDPGLADSIFGLARVLQARGNANEAEPLFREALAMRRSIYGDDHPDVASTIYYLADSLLGQRKLLEAETLFREAIEMQRKMYGNENQLLARSMANLANVLSIQGRPTEAEPLFNEALAMRQKLLGNESSEVAWSLDNLGSFLYYQGRWHEAESPLREALAIRRKVYSNNNPLVLGTLDLLAMTLARQGKLIEAEPFAREGLAIREKNLPDDWETFNARSLLGDDLLEEKKYDEAEPLLLSGYEGLKQREDKIPADARSPRLKESLLRLVQLYEDTSRPDQAAEWRKKLDELEKDKK
jgi:serine/threonine protein kinase/Tfp pilus assembly protein PilF